MARRTLIVVTLFVLMASSAGSSAGPRVAFQNNRLKVDGIPFFMYGCWGTPDKDYVEFRRRHFNSAFMGWKAAVEEGPEAAAAGLMVIPYPYAPGWTDKTKEAMQSVANEDWVLAWNIGDDLRTNEHLEAALKVREEMRAIDPQHRPIMFDAIGQYDEFAKIPDMWCAYAYPLVKPALDALERGKPGGLSEYSEWLRARRLQGRPDCFFWTWAQCHVQIWYNEKYLGGTEKDKWRPSRFPDGEHLRLISSHAISAGARGLMWFVARYFQDDYIGRDRYARAAIIGCELDVVGQLIAQGKTGERLKTSDPTLWATPIDFPGGRLICLLKTGDLYHYQIDAAQSKNVRIETGANGRIYQIGYDFAELAQPECSFEVTSWLLVTQDSPLVESLRETHQAVLPDMARFAAEELDARIAKAEPVFQELDRGAEAVRDAKQRLTKTREALERQNWVEAGRTAEEGIRILRVAQCDVWREAWTEQVLNAGLEMTDFYVLPQFFKQITLLKANAWGPNRLPNGSFESDDAWEGAKLAHDTKGKAVFVTDTKRTGNRALRLSSDSPTIYQGEPKDWVTTNVVSEKIPAKPGEMWEITAWVFLPKALEQTSRGVTIAINAYTADGQSIRGYGGPEHEATQVEATDGWQPMRHVVPLRSPDTAAIAARLAICGVGEAYLDDVTVRRLEPPRE